MPPPLPRVTPPPSENTQHLLKRHYYTCGPTTLAWEAEWYTQSFYTASSRSYDAAASLGPVQPPENVVARAKECSSGITTTAGSMFTGSSTPSGSIPGISAGGAGGTVTATLTAGGSTFEATYPASTSAVTRPASSGFTSTPTSASVSTVPLSSASSTSWPTSSSGAIPSNAAQVSDPSSINTCAGDTDFQAWGAVASAAFAVLLGGLLWLAWAVMRGRIPALYTPRSYAVSPDHGPSAPFAFLTFLFPFLPGGAPSSGSSASFAFPVVHASLKLLALSSIVALGAGLPLFAANVPCLSIASPANYLGGRLGSLTDLSLLRLLNALDPAPEAPARDASIQILLRTQQWRRALPQTIGPAISSARIRLIIVLVLIGLLSLVGGLWIVARTYASLYSRRKAFEFDTCNGLDMVVVAAKDAPSWIGTSEERLRKMLLQCTEASAEDHGCDQEVSVIGIFAIPDTDDLQIKAREREVALFSLERSEADYLSASVRRPGKPPPTAQAQRLSVDRPPLGQADGTALSPDPRGALKGLAHPAKPSRFREVNRNSMQSSFVQFEIGQRIKVTEEGKFVPDPSPESELGRQLGQSRSPSVMELSRSTLPMPSPEITGPAASPGSTPPVLEDEVGESESELDQMIPAAIPRYSPGPSRLPEFHPSPPFRSARPSAVPSPATHPSSEVEKDRLRLQRLNEEVATLQLIARQAATAGTGVRGWIVIGRGLRYLPMAIRVEGMTMEDIDWRHIGADSGERWFWVKIGMVGTVLSLLLIPVIGLTNASAPGFAENLPFLQSLGRSDGFGSGVGQGFLPGLIMSLAVTAAVGSSIYLASRLRTVSVHRRDTLAVKAVFWLLLWLCIVWAVLVSALEFAVQGLGGETQKSRAVADGAIYSSWWLFIFLLNVGIIVPALILLQPRRLWQYYQRRRYAVTPREMFRLTSPAPFSPAPLLAGPLLAVLYTLSLSLLFPLLCIPLFVLLYLSYVVLRHMTSYVFIDKAYSDGCLGLWLVRRLGWALGIQPALYGLILLSRREWAIGGVSCAVAALALVLAETLTARRLPERTRSDLSAEAKKGLEAMATSMRSAEGQPIPHRRATSDSSMLQRLTVLLPGYSRLPLTCPLPLGTETVDDMVRTELASTIRPDLAKNRRRAKGKEEGRQAFFHDPTERNRGLVYPREMLLPAPVVWLPHDSEERGAAEAADLESHWGLMAVVDPAPVR